MKKFIAFFIAVIVLFTLNPASLAENTTSQENSNLEVYFLNVGEGDSAIIREGGHTLMIDGGTSDYSDLIYSFLKNKGIERIDYMIASHGDADHVGGLSGALNYATIGIAVCTREYNDTDTFAAFTKYLDKQNCSIIVPNQGDTFTLGDVRVEILAPQKGIALTDNTSIVIKLIYGDISFLFTGDSEEEDENFLLDAGYDLNADVLKVGHHGSSSSTTAEFLEAVSPAYAVISVGENTYGHPSDDVLYKN